MSNFIGYLLRATDGTKHCHVSRWRRVSGTDAKATVGMPYRDTGGYTHGVRYVASTR